MPPAVIPSTKYFCAKKYSRIGGIREIKDIARIWFHGVDAPWLSIDIFSASDSHYPLICRIYHFGYFFIGQNIVCLLYTSRCV